MGAFAWNPNDFSGGGGSGNVSGPGSSTDNALVRWNGVTGNLIQNSNAILTDAGALTLVSTIAASNLSGTNTGDQTITLTGDVTGSGTGSFAATIANDVIDNANINSAAAIAYSKLNLSDSIANADINTAAAIAYSKLSLSDSIVNADINSAAAIAGTKISPNFGAQDISTTNDGSLGSPSISIDGTHGIRKAAANQVNLETPGSSGSYALTINAASATSSYNLAAILGDGEAFIGPSNSSRNFALGVGTTAGIRIDTSHNVSIPNGTLTVSSDQVVIGSATTTWSNAPLVISGQISGSTQSPSINFNLDGTVEGIIGVARTAGSLITGSAEGNLCFRSVTDGVILFGNAGGTSIAAQISGAGTVMGPSGAGGGIQHIVYGQWDVRGDGTNIGLDVSTSNVVTVGASGGTATHTVNGILDINTSADIARVGGILSQNAVNYSLSAGATETAKTYTVPASTLANDGDTIIVEAFGQFASNGNNKTVSITWAGISAGSTGSAAFNGGSYKIRTIFSRIDASTLRRMSHIKCENTGADIDILREGNISSSLSGARAIDIDITGVAASDLNTRFFSVEFLPAN